MTDRELLEAAANAAGVPLKNDFKERFDYYMADRLMWNPLVDDGDALRLAVKMRMMIEVWPDKVSVTTTHRATGDEDATELAGCDLDAATRKAIVRVAAAMAKQ